LAVLKRAEILAGGPFLTNRRPRNIIGFDLFKQTAGSRRQIGTRGFRSEEAVGLLLEYVAR
jgi:hypothetical protein